MRIAITGATGMLGGNILYEFIKTQLANLDRLDLFVLGRDRPGDPLSDRVRRMFIADGVPYILGAGADPTVLAEFFDAKIRCVPYALGDVRIGEADAAAMRRAPIDFFIHSAALLDFRDRADTRAALARTNIEGTRKAFDLALLLRAGEFDHISTAYACGKAAGAIPPGYRNPNIECRNPYEESKIEAESLIEELACRHGMRARIFRPSTIAGRLIEDPIAQTPKFDVFYAWAGFFRRQKQKQLLRGQDMYRTPISMPIRAHISAESGLNIVPVDYAAKVLRAVCMSGDRGTHYHLVNDDETPHRLYIPIMLDTVRVSGLEMVAIPPPEQSWNRLEQAYYKTVGWLYTPYITAPPMLFGTGNLRRILADAGLRCPAVDAASFQTLMDFARNRDFGIAADDCRSTAIQA